MSRMRVSVPEQPGSYYDVIVRSGSLHELPMFIENAVDAAAYVVIASDNVAAIHGETLLDRLRSTRLRAELITFADGEAHKTRDTWAALSDAMLAHGFGRDCCVIALGGGVTGDIAGFVAATYMRGVPVVQVPTTLLAMIDASVGGKTGVDTEAGKNLIGAFHSPRLVVIDPHALWTLPADEMRYGMAEAVKHGAILDEAYFGTIERDVDALLEARADVIERLVIRSVQLKAQVAAVDPYEQGERAILNFGHTVGHALERASAYEMKHGAAVSVGMVVEAALGEAAGITEKGTADRLANVLARLGLPTRLDRDPAGLVESMRFDKKARRAEPRFALLRRIGECAQNEKGEWTHAVAPETLDAVLHDR